MGIELERFVDSMVHDASCFICSCILEDPLEINPCGHHFCRGCWLNWSTKNSCCAFCGASVVGVKDSRLLWSLIQNHNVYCIQKEKGCPAIYKFGFNKLHEGQCLYQGYNRVELNDKCTVCENDSGMTHDCLKELSLKMKQCSIRIINLEHENQHLSYKLMNREKEYLERISEIESQFYEESLKYNKEIRDLRLRAAATQGEQGKKNNQIYYVHIDLERLNGSLGFNIMGGATQDDKHSDGIIVSRIVEGGAADGKLQLHDCILEVDSVDLRSATHELAVKAFRESGNPVKMLVRRQISKSATSDFVDVGTQTFGVMFAVTCEEEFNEKHTNSFCKPQETLCKFSNQKRWLNPHEFTESIHKEGVSMMSQQNSDTNKNEQYDSAYDTLLTQKSSRSVRLDTTRNSQVSHDTTRVASPTDSIDKSTTRSSPVLKNNDNTSGVTLRNKIKTEQAENNRLSTFYILPSDISAKEWNDVEKVVNFDYDFEYEEVVLKKSNGKFGLLLCVGGDENDVAVYVGDLEEGSEAETTGKVMVGDQIVQINGCQVKNVENAYKILQENETITLVVARAVYEQQSDCFDEAEETDLDLLDSINEEAESHYLSLSNPVKLLDNATYDNKAFSYKNHISEKCQHANEKNLGIAPVTNNNNDNNIERLREEIIDNTKSEKMTSVLKNFVRNKFGNSEKTDKRSSCGSDESKDQNKIPRCDSNSSSTSGKSIKTQLNEESAFIKEQKHLSKMKAYLDSPSIARHRVNQKIIQPRSSINLETYQAISCRNTKEVDQCNLPVKQFSSTYTLPCTENTDKSLNNRRYCDSISSLRSSMKTNLVSNKTKPEKHVQIDSHPGWNATEKRVWEEFKIIQSMEAKENSLDPTKIEAEWRVRRSKDGKHVYIKKTNSNRNKVLKEREDEINKERCGMTTDDDAFTIYQGQYWDRDQRKRQLVRHQDRRQKLLEKAAIKATYQNETGRKIAEFVQRNMTLPGAVFDNFITIEEILSQRNRSGIFNGPIHVTTI
ncbi:E3 ubiquitin-protein ligase PDZRN3 [Hydra vulgaris]|uniref:E3 ubiquitin-protein ligase PDZRN3 n=1 Tax=Hydra vulgaris TaxID=6087 RepID=UPI001F5FAB5B|nr:E3 ubiquitin-protein ligase PDZRN3 [Hydra vulgaris]